MKFLKYIFFMAGLLSLASCEDYFGEDSNVDPDNPIEATANVVLPQIQVRLAYLYGGDLARYTGIFTQHVNGVARQFTVIGNYGLRGNDVDNAWINVYGGILGSNTSLIKIAEEGGFNHYKGIAIALEVYTMMQTTDLWGDVPYSDASAFAEKGVYNPTFDTQQEIYTTLFARLEEARTLLSGDNGGFAPGRDDLIYGGNISRWIKFCNLLEARGRLHLVKSGGSYAEVVNALNKGVFTSSADDAGIQFTTVPTENAPWFQYIAQRDDIEVGIAYTDLLTDLSDPRIETYGAPHDGDHPIFKSNQKVFLLTYTEQEFIKAEALLATSTADAYEAYLSGIESSFDEALVADDYADYIAQPAIGVGAGNLSMEDVITQKYIALLTSPEVFSDWRRTGFPELTPITGSTIPRRFPYPQVEQDANTNTPSPVDVNLFTRVWWDK